MRSDRQTAGSPNEGGALLVVAPGAVLLLPGLVAVRGPLVGLGGRLTRGVGTHAAERAGLLPALDLAGADVVVPLVPVGGLGDLVDPVLTVLGGVGQAGHDASFVQRYVDSSHAC